MVAQKGIKTERNTTKTKTIENNNNTQQKQIRDEK